MAWAPGPERQDHYAGPWHYEKAETWADRALEWPEGSEQRAQLTATAQVHATLAQTAAEMHQHQRMSYRHTEAWDRVLSPRRAQAEDQGDREAGG
jgi:hypothetical protein